MQVTTWLAAAALAVWMLASPIAAHAAECPNTCVAFGARADAEQFLTMLAQPDAKPAGVFLRKQIADQKAELVPVGTQFVMLAEHHAGPKQWAFYAIQLPGAPVTKYLVAIR